MEIDKKEEISNEDISLKAFNEKYFEALTSVIKFVLTISIPIGFIYLLSYCKANGISLPISLSELPTLLLAMFGLGSGFAFILLGFFFLPATQKFGLLGNGKFILFEKETKLSVNINKYISIMAIPLFMSLFAFLNSVNQSNTYWNEAFYIILAAVSLLSFFYGIFKHFKGEHLKVIGFTLYFLLICLYWLFMGLVLIIKLIENQLNNMSEIGAISTLIVLTSAFLILLFLMVVPNNKENKIPRSFWYIVGVLVIFIPPLINPIAVKLSEVSLKIMRIGGGYQTLFLIKDKYRTLIPPQLINQDFPDRTVPLYSVLDIGKRIYVKLNNKKNAIVFAIPSDAIGSQIYWIGNMTPSPSIKF